ncbi:putative phosphoglycerate mutase [Anaerosolibacter carboniphilus]|uniref:Putative phosphoglycerate mutase n=1 Tax=Anaerosolibacter carboniphilus TaxID=1417629 RepID=A0A841KZB5_9FIRM|nr:histidine phosphatase family protein [Anaerosolibacter carboniphilus]MBB6218841.1 putative phosphoglycerate mutase [Anaerosolibacter carboniphilus]
MTKLYITRHGQTQWNIEKRLQGHLDSPLTEVGAQQAAWLGEALSSVDFDAVYASSSPRALRTAEIICSGRNFEVQPNDLLREIHVGEWEGRLTSELETLYPEEFENFFHRPHLYRPMSGESYFDTGKRVIAGIEEIIEKHPDENVLIVTHAVALKLIMAHFEDRPMEKLWDPPYMHPTNLNVVEIKNNVTNILLHGDISHYK